MDTVFLFHFIKQAMRLLTAHITYSEEHCVLWTITVEMVGLVPGFRYTLTLTYTPITSVICFSWQLKLSHLVSIHLSFYHLAFNQIPSYFKIIPSLQRVAITDINNAGALLTHIFLSTWLSELYSGFPQGFEDLCTICTLIAHVCEHFTFPWCLPGNLCISLSEGNYLVKENTFPNISQAGI